MKTQTTYICSACGQKFKTEKECLEHEQSCILYYVLGVGIVNEEGEIDLTGDRLVKLPLKTEAMRSPNLDMEVIGSLGEREENYLRGDPDYRILFKDKKDKDKAWEKLKKHIRKNIEDAKVFVDSLLEQLEKL